VNQRPGSIASTWHHAAIDEKQLRAQTYTNAYQADYTFEAVMVRVRQRATIALLPIRPDLVVVEVGCGMDLLVERAARERAFERWVIVEPSVSFAATARERMAHESRVHVVEGFFEEAGEEIRTECGRSPDVVVCSSVLHEVDDPAALLTQARQLLEPSGRLIVNVPNAQSIHRRLAVAMGLTDSAADLSERNHQLGQPRVFDAVGLASLLVATGFRVTESGGYFFKPFTHAQMADLGFLDATMVAGLEQLGTEFPELASEIYAVGRPDRGHG
jgi:2-polyprenyl-3-methyl-5-hydroxy-6-metoxy-1,4-benzoquinol methylase